MNGSRVYLRRFVLTRVSTLKKENNCFSIPVLASSFRAGLCQAAPGESRTAKLGFAEESCTQHDLESILPRLCRALNIIPSTLSCLQTGAGRKKDLPPRKGGGVDVELLRSEMPAQRKSCRDGKGCVPQLQERSMILDRAGEPEKQRDLE